MLMKAMSPSDQKMLSSWNPERQQAYRAKHHSLVFHVLLDASPSMQGEEARNLRRSFNMYLQWLQRHADSMSVMDVRCFSTPLDPSHPLPIGMVTPLTEQTYDPAEHGSGTALYRAVGETCTTATNAGQHVLVVFTDGADKTSRHFEWSVSAVCTLLTTLQEQQGWLAVFLGAFPDAVAVGKAMGFQPGNCLTFRTDEIPEAFARLRTATQRYLAAGPQERKLLATGGVFR
jgi:hypothetical protein